MAIETGASCLEIVTGDSPRASRPRGSCAQLPGDHPDRLAGRRDGQTPAARFSKLSDPQLKRSAEGFDPPEVVRALGKPKQAMKISWRMARIIGNVRPGRVRRRRSARVSSRPPPWSHVVVPAFEGPAFEVVDPEFRLQVLILAAR
jgi:hypothetical protein